MTIFPRKRVAQLPLKAPLIVTCLSLTLIGCGGGDDNPSVPPIQNKYPTVSATAAQQTYENEEVLLNGTATDIDGTITKYLWQYKSGPAVTIRDANSLNASFTAPDVSSEQTLVLILTVEDDKGASAVDELSIIIIPKNQPPIVVASAISQVNEKSELLLSGTAIDNDGTVVSHIWQYGDGPFNTIRTPEQLNTTMTVPSVMTDQVMTLKLTATDNDGASASDTVQILIIAIHESPIADAGDPIEVQENTTIDLDGSRSFDPDGDISHYQWRQLSTNAPNAEILQPTNVKTQVTLPELTADSEFIFELIVTDAQSNEATSTVTIIARDKEGLANNSILPLTAVTNNNQANLQTRFVDLNQNGSTNLTSTLTSADYSYQYSDSQLKVRGARALSSVFKLPDSANNDVIVTYSVTALPTDIPLKNFKLYEEYGDTWSPVSTFTTINATTSELKYLIRNTQQRFFFGYDGLSGLHTLYPTNNQLDVVTHSNNSIEAIRPSDAYDQVTKHTIHISGFESSQYRWGNVTKSEMITWFTNAQAWLISKGLKVDDNTYIDIHEMNALSYVTESGYAKYKVLHVSSNNLLNKNTIKKVILQRYIHTLLGYESLDIENIILK
ncbi:REJ domain-containing protein [Pseudoalteromonas sp. S558]|uniref:PKD domain-containing protein n=1 Tax=Pseudoalteromonas sp. S558 TaxID=2066515 RepID=UPI00110BE72B|nr:REJ domain-containing protein [Pseudoalteromonas sp. S558]TMO04004.1 hypothetical protein CWB66_09420 [Pseudoalteromonas sp. S558]